ncbi:MAG TPA: threonyl-tRNA synthetase editing domain-containing protein [archaeon]|nr:threonyl-tRNA synthetase editing domain-containing protein [archaeon]
MKILFLHCDSFSYKVTEETPIAEPNPPHRSGEFKDVVAALTCVEQKDEQRKDSVKQSFAQELATFCDRIKCKKVVLYPYAHLSRSLSKPAFAKDLLQDLEVELAAQGFEVHRSPFGWYKEFKIECKGHPLSEAFRDV